MELKHLAPIIAYYCEFYAIQKGLEILKQATFHSSHPNVLQISITKKFLMA